MPHHVAVAQGGMVSATESDIIPHDSISHDVCDDDIFVAHTRPRRSTSGCLDVDRCRKGDKNLHYSRGIQ